MRSQRRRIAAKHGWLEEREGTAYQGDAPRFTFFRRCASGCTSGSSGIDGVRGYNLRGVMHSDDARLTRSINYPRAFWSPDSEIYSGRSISADQLRSFSPDRAITRDTTARCSANRAIFVNYGRSLSIYESYVWHYVPQTSGGHIKLFTSNQEVGQHVCRFLAKDGRTNLSDNLETWPIINWKTRHAYDIKEDGSLPM